jgi:hypothetical protein
MNFQTFVFQSQLIGTFLHSMHNCDQSENVKRFSLQLILQPISFDAGGCFAINTSLLVSAIATFLTYEIILIQFYFDD